MNEQEIEELLAEVDASMGIFILPLEDTTPTDEDFRLRDEYDRQLFIVNDRWTYVWGGEGEIRVGDRVALPGINSVWYGEVTALGSSFKGYARTVITKD